MKARLKIWYKFARRGALVAFLTAAVCFGAIGTKVAFARATTAKSHESRKTKAANSKTRSASVKNIAYKIPTHRRRYRRRRHHVTLPKQPSSDRAQEIQTALQRGGYYSGKPTGKWDSGTQESLRRFQAANGLPPTGKLDALSLQKMGLGSDVAGVSAPRPVAAGNSPADSSGAPKNPGQ